jgi:hypothetical protein
MPFPPNRKALVSAARKSLLLHFGSVHLDNQRA